MARRGGWRRAGSKGRFRYLDGRGNRIEDEAKLERIEALVIPPAWKEVWISPNPRAKLQATGVDRAGRRQYLYHPEFRAQQEQAKYDKLVRFAAKLPDLRLAMSEHMDLDTYEPERVCAIAVRLINLGWFRVGSDRYAKTSRTYGVTTLYKKHVSVRGNKVSFAFRGKHKVLVRTTLVDGELAGAIKELLALPGGGRLFRYENGNGVCALSGAVLNGYIQEYMGEEFSAKDFRTWGGTLIGSSRLGRARSARVGGRREAADRGGDADGRRPAREYPGGGALLVRQPGRDRAVPRRPDGGRLPSSSASGRPRARNRPRSGGASRDQLAQILANQEIERSSLISLRVYV